MTKEELIELLIKCRPWVASEAHMWTDAENLMKEIDEVLEKL